MTDDMTDEQSAEIWWDTLSAETRDVLAADPRQALDPGTAGEVQRAGIVLVSLEIGDAVETRLPDDAVEFVEAQASA
jgi:hypothetical protein